MSLRAAAGAALAAAFALPLVLLLLGALQAPGADDPTSLRLLPVDPGPEAVRQAFEITDLARQLRNSLLVAALAVPLTVLTASWAGFAIACLGARPQRRLLALSLMLTVIPVSALWVPRFVLFREAGFIDTYVPLLAPALMGTSPLFVLLFWWSHRRVPRDLLDAARLEGLSALATWWRVSSPLVRPTAFAVGALAFVLHWGNVVDPLLYLNDPALHTAPLGLRELRGVVRTDFPVLLAGAVVVTLPVVVLFALAQRRLLRALA